MAAPTSDAAMSEPRIFWSTPMVVIATTSGRQVAANSDSDLRSVGPRSLGASAWAGPPRTSTNSSRNTGTSKTPPQSCEQRVEVELDAGDHVEQRYEEAESHRLHPAEDLLAAGRESLPSKQEPGEDPGGERTQQDVEPEHLGETEHAGQDQHHEPDGELAAAVQSPLGQLREPGRSRPGRPEHRQRGDHPERDQQRRRLCWAGAR